MDIQQLRGWADFTDKALVISTVVAVLAVVALGVSAWFSVRFASALRSQELASFDRYKGEAGRHAAQLEADAARAADRIVELERSVAGAAAAVERAAAAQREVAEARQRIVELETRLAGANALPGRDDRATPSGARPGDPGQSAPQPTAPPAAEGLARFAGSRASIYVVEEVSDGAVQGAAIGALLTDAGWESGVWRWSGVSGIVGVVILIKEGSAPAVDEAASGLLEALRAAGYNAAKGHWPANWSRFRGMLQGPQVPGPTDAPIRIVIGLKAK
jgi:hypothetical protein